MLLLEGKSYAMLCHAHIIYDGRVYTLTMESVAPAASTQR